MEHCIHEEQIQNHSLQITELETKSQYKEQAIMEIKKDLKDANDKLDALTEKFNEVIRKSESSDTALEKRVELIETRIDLYEKFFDNLKEDEKQRKADEDKKRKNLIAICAVIATLTGVAISVITKFI